MTLSKTLTPPTLGPATGTTTMIEPAADTRAGVEATWRVYPWMIDAVNHGRPFRSVPEVRLSAACGASHFAELLVRGPEARL
jgi:hypothetical protein